MICYNLYNIIYMNVYNFDTNIKIIYKNIYLNIMRFIKLDD